MKDGINPSLVIARKQMNWQLKPHYSVVSEDRNAVVMHTNNLFTAKHMCNGLVAQGEKATVVKTVWLYNGGVEFYQIYGGRIDTLPVPSDQLELWY